MNIIAIDPGKNGGIASRSVGVYSAQKMPLAGKEIDLNAIAHIVKETHVDIIVVEKASAMSKGGTPQGVVSMFTYGTGYGGLLGIAAALDIRIELVQPLAWKKVVLAGTPKDKDAAIAYCRRAFPQISLVPPKCRTPHDGMADALCILEYGVRTFDAS